MSIKTTRIRLARPGDAEGIAAVHDAAWREAYQGIIPGPDLDRTVARRGPRWWQGALRRGSRVAVLDFDDRIAGYASFGRNRVGSLPFAGEIFELYLMPEFQGLGFGTRLFTATRRELANLGHKSTLVWALSDNERAVHFYERLGGLLVGRAHEHFGDVQRERIAFGWR